MVRVDRLRRWFPVALFLGIPSFLVFPILIRGQMLAGADVLSVFHYSRIVIADAFRGGRLPTWDPHVMAGFPMLAEPQSAVFYPPTWLCLLLSAGAFWTVSAWMHLALSGVFAQRWLERGLGLNRWSATVGALVYMVSGFISGHVLAGHVNYVWAYPWIPALLWRLEERLAAPSLKNGVWLAVVLAMLFLAGVPQFVFFAGLLVIARLLHFILAGVDGRRDRARQSLRPVGWLLLGLAFCAPQLFPTLELIGEMQRGGGGTSPYYTDYSMKPREVGALIFPPSPSTSPWWETCGFVGGGVLLLTLAIYLGRHPQRYLWTGLAALALLLAFGDSLPVYRGFVTVVPGAGWFRGPGRYLLIFTLAMAGLAAIGFEALWNRGRRGPRLAGALLAVSALGQLLMFARPCFSGKPEDGLRMPAALRTTLQGLCGLEGRVVNGSPNAQLIGQCQAEGLDHVGGYEPMMLSRYAEVMNVARGAPADSLMVILASAGEHRVLWMLAARVWVTHRPQTTLNPLPRAWVVNNAVVLEDKAERLKILAEGPWDPEYTVILESYPKVAPPDPTKPRAGKARVLSKRPGFYELEAECDAPALLVLSEAYYPGWSATVDGRETEVVPANHLIQTIWLPKGKHLVRFEYRSRWLPLGFVVAVLAALVPVGLLVRHRRGQLALQRLPGAP